MPDEERPLRLDWTGGRDVAAAPANVVLVQRVNDEITLSFGHAPPPIEIAESGEEEARAYFEGVGYKVTVQQIGRVTLTPRAALLLANNLRAVGIPPPVEGVEPTNEESSS